MSTWVVIPAHDEADNIAHLVRQCRRFGHVLVVDDGSMDATAYEAARAGAVIAWNGPDSQHGDGIRRGLREALSRGASRIVTINAGNTHNSNDIPRLLGALRSMRADVVIGSKVMAYAERHQPLLRWLLTWGASCFLGLLLGKGLVDYSSFRAYSRAGAEMALPLMHDLDPRCYAFNPPLTYRLYQAGLRVVQWPIYYESRNSTLDWSQAWAALWQVLVDWKADKLRKDCDAEG